MIQFTEVMTCTPHPVVSHQVNDSPVRVSSHNPPKPIDLA
jgi:hypothetical protein